MKIYTEDSLSNFNFWSGAKQTAEAVNDADAMDIVEAELEVLYPDGLSDTELNDLFWFEPEFIFQLAGIDNPWEEEDEEEE